MSAETYILQLKGFSLLWCYETMQDYKEGYLMVWTNYMSPCNSIVGLYVKGTCDVLSVTMETHMVHKRGECSLNFNFCNLSEKLIR